jgi:hypothetical protein
MRISNQIVGRGGAAIDRFSRSQIELENNHHQLIRESKDYSFHDQHFVYGIIFSSYLSYSKVRFQFFVFRQKSRVPALFSQ